MTVTQPVQSREPVAEKEDIEGYLTRPSLSTLKGAFAKAAFVLGSLVLVTVCARNSLTWHLARIWGGCRSYVWQNMWDKFLQSVGTDHFYLFVPITYLVTVPHYFVVGSIYSYLDVKLLQREYKIQPGTNEPLDMKKFWKMVRAVFFNQAILTIPFIYVMFKLHEWRGITDVRVLPSFHSAVFQLVVFLLVEEVLFYYLHWGLHHRRVYKYIHKQHHEWTATVAFVSLYAHPLEHLFSNLLPVAMGPLLCGSHISMAWLWSILAALNTLNSHSGYHLPFFPSPEYHDFHHLKFTQCYGVLGILDYLHGTDDLFRSSVNYKRHVTLLGTTPAREQFPEKEKEI